MNKIDKTETLTKILSHRRFTVDVFQREYRWGRKQIEQMLSDFQGTFEDYYDPDTHDTPAEVMNYGFYYMGCIICTGGTPNKIIDGQQRLTSLTLLLIYLNNLQKAQAHMGYHNVRFEDMIYDDHFGTKSFNIDVEERLLCLQALIDNNTSYVAENESAQNMLERYRDIEDLFSDELKGEALPYFIYWIKEKVILLEIDTPSEDEAHTIFLTMNDRGLSLNSAEMMKAYIIQQITEVDRAMVNHRWQDNINRIKSASFLDTSGVVNTEDVEFISTWLRANYAETLREGKRGATDEDFELLGEKFHTWVRNHAKGKMGLGKSSDYKELILTEMTKVTDLYLRIKEYSARLTPGYEEVFYNANRDLNYQMMLIISAVSNGDSDEDIRRKIQMTAKFVDNFATIRIFNFRKVNWNTNKYLLFRVMREIRDQDCRTVGMVFVRTLGRMDISIDAITKFSLNQFSGRYMLHLLARFTSYVNEKMGNPSQFDIYVDRKRKGNTYDIEHILPDDYDSYREEFDDVDDFQTNRQFIGDLIILTRDKNRSYQAMKYQDKVQKYAGDNILAQALNPTAYQNNPQFIRLARQYGFEPIAKFTKESISDRAKIYLQMAVDIWDSDTIKELAGGWDDDEEKDFFKNDRPQEFTVEYYERSWPDALKYGFLSANMNNSGRYLRNIQVGDTVYCHIAGSGFVGIGECTAVAVPMGQFKVDDDGETVLIGDVQWIQPDDKKKLDPNREIFIRVEWKKYVSDQSEGYWEKGMTSVPLVAYMLSDKSTYRKVQEHFAQMEGRNI
ncbi:MAG: DUF262 domain-containing protein [Lachnospiraceae bacterium]|nr:DUF262 domain-containing protein [Lachnospiraceae bacterium]